MKKYPIVEMLHSPAILPDEVNLNAIQPDAQHDLPYDPHAVLEKSRLVHGYTATIDQLHVKASRLDEIAEPTFRALVQDELAEVQDDTVAKLERTAIQIPYGLIGRDALTLGLRKLTLAAQVEESRLQHEQLTAAIRQAVCQAESVLDGASQRVQRLAQQTLDTLEERREKVDRPQEERLERITAAEAAVSALYAYNCAPWPIPSIRRPESLPEIKEPEPVTPEVEERVRPQTGLVVDWKQPRARGDAKEVQAVSYDPDFDEVWHELNGTTPPKSDEELIKDSLVLLIDRLRDASMPLTEMTSDLEIDLTQHERIAAFLIAHAGQTLTALDIGKFLYADRNELDAAFAIDKVRTLLGPKSHGKKVLEAMSIFDYAIQYGSKEFEAGGRRRTMRLYRGLSTALTVLPETPDPTITWKPFENK